MSEDELKSWIESGLPKRETSPLWFLLQGTRGWLVNPVDTRDSAFEAVRVATWDRFWDFEIERNVKFGNLEERDVLKAVDVFGEKMSMLVCRFISMMVNTDDRTYVTQSGFVTA